MSRLATLPVCPERLDFVVQIITQTGEKATFINTLQRHQRPVSDHFIAVV
ncbi:hypothetical protein ACMFY2_14225 [Enterobacter cloacae subsp. cloacae]